MAELAPLQTTHEWVRARLRQAIMDGDYKPGDPLKQTELAARLQVSVTPVREAMRDLASEGLVVLDPQRVARVRDLDAQEAGEVAAIRELLEPLAAQLAARHAEPEQIERIGALAAECAASVTDAEYLDSNRRFHMAVIAAANAPVLAGILSNLRLISSMYLASAVRIAGGTREKSKQEHLDLAAAIAAHEDEEAIRIMTAHLLPSRVVMTSIAGEVAEGTA